MVDVVELFGGEGGVGKLCIRRRLRRGGNFDLVTCYDLTKESDQAHIIKYITTHEPLVVVMGPPCTSFGAWSHLNRIAHEAT